MVYTVLLFGFWEIKKAALAAFFKSFLEKMELLFNEFHVAKMKIVVVDVHLKRNEVPFKIALEFHRTFS